MSDHKDTPSPTAKRECRADRARIVACSVPLETCPNGCSLRSPPKKPTADCRPFVRGFAFIPERLAQRAAKLRHHDV
jgi:hypothetical protein